MPCRASSEVAACFARVQFTTSSCGVSKCTYNFVSQRDIMGMKAKNQIYGRFKRKSLPARLKKKKTRYVPVKKKRSHDPDSLRVLCKRAVKKYKLLNKPESKKFTPPETFSVVGGKPLRKRSETLCYGKPRKERRYHPKTLVWLCQRVVEEYNLLPQTEETLQPSTQVLLVEKNKYSQKRSRSQSDEVEKRPKGRPRKTKEEGHFALRCEIKRPRGRPHKDPSADSYVVKYTYPQQTHNVRVKEELDLPPDVDPLQQDDADDYTIEIKEEIPEDDYNEFTDNSTIQVPQITSQAIVINPLVPHITSPAIVINPLVPGPSSIVAPTANVMTVVMDEYQIFANSVAEQLRALPPNRALLLQLDIQSMIDNERQLMNHEN